MNFNESISFVCSFFLWLNSIINWLFCDLYPFKILFKFWAWDLAKFNSNFNSSMYLLFISEFFFMLIFSSFKINFFWFPIMKFSFEFFNSIFSLFKFSISLSNNLTCCSSMIFFFSNSWFFSFNVFFSTSNNELLVLLILFILLPTSFDFKIL